MPVNLTKAEENYTRYQYLRDNGHSDFVQKSKKCEDFFAGMQWDEQALSVLRAQRRPALTINMIFAEMVSVMGQQIENRADIKFVPRKDGTDETATALSKTYLNVCNVNDYKYLETEMAMDGFIRSRGFIDVRMAFDDNFRGEVVLSVPNPNNVLIDSDGESYDPDTWKDVVISKWLSPNDIRVLYNEKDADHLEKKSESEFGHDSIDDGARYGGTFRRNQDGDKKLGRRIRVLERQYKQIRKRRFFVNMKTGDQRPVPDTWDDERVGFVMKRFGLTVIDRRAEQIRWLVTADDVVLHDDWSPYKHFTVVPYFPYFLRGRTLGLVEQLISLQELLNKSTSQELHIVNTSANSGWKVKRNSLKNMSMDELEARGAETGLVMELDDPNDAEKIQPNNVPTGHDRLAYTAREHMKAVGGVPDSVRGMDRADVAGRAIAQKQAAASVNMTLPFDNLGRTRAMVAQRVVDLIQTYYTEERVIQVTGRDLTAETETVVMNQMTPEGQVVNDLTIGQYSAVAVPVPLRETHQQTQFQEAMEMRQEGIAVPDDVIIENSTLDRKAEIAKRIREQTGVDASEAQNRMAQLEEEIKQGDRDKALAEAELKQAEAKLATIRAAKTAQDLEQSDEPSPELELQRERMVEELRLQREKMDEELAIKREELRLKRREMYLKVAEREAAKQRGPSPDRSERQGEN